jgi:putative glutamine amidotransferase
MSAPDNSKDKAPIIGLTGMRWPDNNKGEMFIMDKVQIHYIEAIQKCGGIPIVLPVLEQFDPETVKRQVSLVDAILIQGGIDIYPSFYGEDPLPELDITSKQTDQFILEVIKCARERKIPLMGICKGMQLINVAFGGTIYQDLKYAGLESKSHRQSEETITTPFHSINVEKDSLLGKLIPNKEKLNVNSYHHQAIKALGKGLRIDAKADDGIIEAISNEGSDQWILGLQFHPEQLIRKNDEFKALFIDFVKQANLFRCK